MPLTTLGRRGFRRLSLLQRDGADSMEQVDFLVIGGGISGASAGCELAALGKTLVVETESQPGYHSTGRSAAMFTPNFGNPSVRAVNAASWSFYANPPDGFADAPLLMRRGALTLARPGEEGKLDAIIAAARPEHPIERIDAATARGLAPVVKPDWIGAGALERGVADMDVAAMHQGFLRFLRRRGGELACSAPLTRLERRDGFWRATCGGREIVARIVVNAAGAWGDAVGVMAGARPQGLVPKRRTALTTDAPQGLALADMPLVDFAGEPAYLRPDPAGIMASLGDETPAEPHDVQPDDMDIALIVDWLETRTLVQVRRAPRAWAGLRSFVEDKCPVVGFDPDCEGFFWLIAQGGYGIMMAPALSRLSASLCATGEAPADLAAAGVDAEGFAPGRFAVLA